MALKKQVALQAELDLRPSRWAELDRASSSWSQFELNLLETKLLELVGLTSMLPASTKGSIAEAVAHSAVEGYWNALTDGVELPLSKPLLATSGGRLPAAVSRCAAEFGAELCGAPIEMASDLIGRLYTNLLADERRSEFGVYYTPGTLASRLLDQAEAAGLDWHTAHILDPACGAGAFLVRAAVRMSNALRGADPAILLHNVSSRLHGWELDPFAAWLTRIFVEAALLPHVRASGRRPEIDVQARDSLDAEETASFDLVIGNPPFGRLKLTPERRERFGRSLFGHANLYGLFMDLAIRLAKPSGLVSFVTPASFLAGEYFKKLRDVLHAEAPPVNVDFVVARKGVFDGVLQETVLSTYRKAAEAAPAAVNFIRALGDADIEVHPAGRFTLPKVSSEPWLLPRHPDEEALAARLREVPHRLLDWGYRVSTGPLVWNRHKDQIVDIAQEGAIPLIWAESVTSDGRFEYRCETRGHKPFFVPKRGDDWLVVTRPCVLVQRTTAKEQARRLIAAEMPAEFLRKHGGVTVENHLNMVVPAVVRPRVSPAVLGAFLNSTAADRAFRCISGSVAVSAYELESMPLPDPDTLEILDRLVASRASRDTIDATCIELYGLSRHDPACSPQPDRDPREAAGNLPGRRSRARQMCP